MDPVPNARRVTLTPDFPSVTQSEAVPRAARRGRPPVPASTPAPSPAFKKLRLEQSGICRPPIGHMLSRVMNHALDGMRQFAAPVAKSETGTFYFAPTSESFREFQ